MNLNDMARRITLREGGKLNLSIAQVKEVMRLTLIELAAMCPLEMVKTVMRYQAKGSSRPGVAAPH